MILYQTKFCLVLNQSEVMVNTIWLWFIFTRLRRYFLVCWTQIPNSRSRNSCWHHSARRRYGNALHWESYFSLSFQIEWDMILMTVFLSISNQMECHFYFSSYGHFSIIFCDIIIPIFDDNSKNINLRNFSLFFPYYISHSPSSIKGWSKVRGRGSAYP